MKRVIQTLAGIVLAVSFTPAQAVPITIGYDTATIDGALSTGEWDAAASWNVFAGAYSGSTLFMMNDDVNLYIALSVIDPTLASNDIMEVRFDNANNGVMDAGDDELFLSTTGFTDSHFNGTNWGISDNTHGAGAVQGFGGFNVFEMMHPLSSGDAFDFSLSAGDTAGFCLRYFDDGLATGNTTVFNPNCVLTIYDQARYIEFTVARAIPEPSTIALLGLGLLALGIAKGTRRI